ncbi:MAG TPA: ubiquitin-conjugating enzyme E2 [Tepidisphaeraceae bacterium]|nr:ubiquitin-conjugating enzyme E2 [Tepidisphaeraceae bacterium]
MVPKASSALQSPGAGGALRSRRLLADESEMRRRFSSGAIRLVKLDGNPPTSYELEFDINGLIPNRKAPATSTKHRARIELTSEYPRVAPVCRMLTPIFHPNIDETHVCVGDHWAAGEHLGDLVIRIGEMIAFQAYNIRSPLDAEAAMWADLNQDKLPTDSRDIRSLVKD